MFLQLFLSIFFLPLAFSLSISKPGCPEECGTLPIPYPFGVGSKCSRNPSFNIDCNSSTNPPKAYLSIINQEVVEIDPFYIRVKYPNLASVCYASSDNAKESNSINLNLTRTPYLLSGSNRLVTIGCDDMVFGIEEPGGSTFVGGCSAFCSDENERGGVGYCPADFATSTGNGCCQSPINGGGLLGAKLVNLAGKVPRKRLFPCSYAFIQDVGNSNETDFSYPLYYLNNKTALLNDDWAAATRPPVVRLSWAVGTENCSQARLNPATYASKEKSICIVDGNEGHLIPRGYLCICIQGYKGNPYLPGGCKPISFSSSIAKSKCMDQCGKVSIPFPFGVGPDCYLEPYFEVQCNTTTNPPRAYLRALNAEILELNSSRLLVDYAGSVPGLACYDFSKGQSRIRNTANRSLAIDLSRTPYTLSDENWITAIGCDAMVVGRIGRGNRSSIATSCATVCGEDAGDYANCPSSYAHTPGDGCCRAAIRRGTTSLEAKLTYINEGSPLSNFSCSYANVGYMHGAMVNFPILTDSTTTLPPTNIIALDWRIGRQQNCDEARLDPTNFACKSNSDCVDFNPIVKGYLCNCSVGFQGNPYIGCKDIDECADDTTNTCDNNSECFNTQGSYQCLCRKGYIGDVRKDDIRCIKLPPPKSNKTTILIGVGSGFGCLLLLLTFFRAYKFFQRRKEIILKERFFKRNGGLLLKQQTKESSLGKTNVFTAKELEVATDNFNESRILGHGGQGTVYKGMLSDGKIVAVKRSKLVEEQHLEQFINEVVILSQINHRNIVKLLGFCLETEVPLLVYEFMPNGTLFSLIHDPKNEYPVSWTMRLKFAADIAGALAYLHSASSIPIYHRDIKSSNILLDEKYVVKISDFGTSMLVAVDQTHLTTMVKGTFGYLDPEYFRSSQFTEKSDVYSFGVVLVELLTGKRPISNDATDEERGLAMRFLTSMEENCLDTILDPLVLEESKKEETILIARLAQRCLNMQGKMRPTMKEVATELESFRISQTSSSGVEDEVEEARAFPTKEGTFSDNEYTWSYDSFSASPLVTHPLMLE